jgi:sigma-B regulation protein RsbU (phosphoserine phosphatase)
MAPERFKKLAEIRFKANPDQLQQVRNVVRAAVASKGCAQELTDCIVLAVDEANANIIRHGYGGSKEDDITLEIFHGQNDLIIRLTDFAAPVDETALQPRDLADIKPGGLGVHLIREIMDEFKYLETPKGVGNILEMRIKLNQPKSF